MKIYRIENPLGSGPINFDPTTEEQHLWRIALDNIFSNYWKSESHPTPMKEFGVDLPPIYIFGCLTKEDLDHWFLPTKYFLALQNFKLVEYEVDPADVLIGRRQVAFIRPQVKQL